MCPRQRQTVTNSLKLQVHQSFSQPRSHVKIQNPQNSRDFAEESETAAWPVTADEYELLEAIGKGATSTVSHRGGGARRRKRKKTLGTVSNQHVSKQGDSNQKHVRPSRSRPCLAFPPLCAHY